MKADFSYFQREFETGTGDLTAKLTQMMGGIKFQDNANVTRFRPFAHALVGFAHISKLPRAFDRGSSSSGQVISLERGTGPAFAFGGGLDIRLTRKLDVRAFQVDYNPSRIGGDTLQNLRLGIGLNFRF